MKHSEEYLLGFIDILTRLYELQSNDMNEILITLNRTLQHSQIKKLHNIILFLNNFKILKTITLTLCDSALCLLNCLL